QAAAFATITGESTGRASSLFNTNRQVASAVGVAILATVLIQRMHAHVASAMADLARLGPAAAAPGVRQAAQGHAALLAFHDAFVAAIVVALIGFLAAFLIRDEDAEASMRAGAPM